MELLKPGGRAAVVLPDGTLFGEGIKTRIKKKLLEECNLHTIVRLPSGVFAPYTTIKTNILFFTKGESTKEVWYYEHPYPQGQKSYSKTRPLRTEEFVVEKAWWADRQENEQAWRVTADQIAASGFNLDVKNPHDLEEAAGDPAVLLMEYQQATDAVREAQIALRAALSNFLAFERQEAE
jgi:type I restriction enzyme M protein